MTKILNKIDSFIDTWQLPKKQKIAEPIVEEPTIVMPAKIITEKKEDIIPKFIVLSDEPENSELFYTAKRVSEECKKLNYKCYIVYIDGAYIKVEDGIRTIHNQNDKKGFVIDNKDTIAIIRGSITRKDSWLDLLSQLEKGNICCVNSRQTVNLCADKYRTYLRLADFGLNQPKTVLIPNTDSIDTAIETLDSDFPVIVKTLRGSKGIGVIFIESHRSLQAIVQLIYKDDELELLLQEYIKTDFDIRVLVLGGKILASMKRVVIEGDFRSNFSQGGKVEEFKLTDLEIEQCILAAKAVNGIYVGVDLIPSKNREKEKPYIIEVNSSPGTEGIESATKDNLIEKLLKHFENPKNKFSVPIECGYKEVVTIQPFGDIPAKFDTGNSGYNVIHADSFTINDDYITWSLFDKKVKSKIVDKIKVNVGGLRDYVEDRYLIHLDVEFLGDLYKDVLFTLDNRSERSKILLERDFMIKLNVMVNPRRKYIVTTKYSL